MSWVKLLLKLQRSMTAVRSVVDVAVSWAEVHEKAAAPRMKRMGVGIGMAGWREVGSHHDESLPIVVLIPQVVTKSIHSAMRRKEMKSLIRGTEEVRRRGCESS